MNRAAAKQLGEAKIPKGNKIGWARNKLLKGYLVARHGWSLELNPKRLFLRLDGHRDIQVLIERNGTGDDVPCVCLSWADIEGDDWYLVEQLEIAR
jgi:hypothetical protein